MSSLSLRRIMIPSSYKNFNLFKHHLGRGGNGYVRDMTDKAKLGLPLCEGVSNSHYIFLLHFSFYLSCLFAHYRKVLTHRCASSHLSSLRQDFCFSLVLFFHGPASRPHLSLCLALRQNMKCALAESLCLWVSRPVGSRAEGLNPPHSLQIICG